MMFFMSDHVKQCNDETVPMITRLVESYNLHKVEPVVGMNSTQLGMKDTLSYSVLVLYLGTLQILKTFSFLVA